MNALSLPVDIQEYCPGQGLPSVPTAKARKLCCHWVIDPATDRLICLWSVVTEAV